MSVGRDASRDRELVKHQHSFSSESSSRSYIPMWDSSDPERAPPPLPLNPGSPSMTTRPNTSALIANAAKALEEKARESMQSSYTTNPMPSRSPDRSLIKGAQHKRMQSLQTTSVRDLRSFLDGVRSPERSPERPHERSPERPSARSVTPARDAEKDYFTGDSSPTRSGTPTPSGRDPLKDMPALRPSTRSMQRPFLGENTPPSATMLALQTMTVPREHLEPPPLSNITNGGSRPSQTSQTPQPLDGISTQLMGIANIVSDLQKEMTQLSRRSRDNATDLIGLKEATTTRDEDIRKSLKDLLSTMHHPPHLHGTSGDFMKDPHMTPTKQFTLPRVPSPSSFFMDERIGSPNPYSVEGAASVAMLEKIIREMVTKDGQERLLGSLQKLVDKATGDTAKKVTELVEFVKQGSAGNALGHNAPPGSAAFQPSPGTGPLTRSFPLPKGADGAKPYASPKAADFVSDEMLKFLRKIKDSVAEAGGVTVGTKSLVEDLRSEVLAMGRELGRRIEDTLEAQGGQRAVESGTPAEDVSVIIQDGLANLKDHLDRVMRERRRQSTSSIMTRNTVDSQEVYDVVKDALTKRGLDQIAAQTTPIDKDAIVTAVREAYESYHPKVEIQQFGLDRDEILQCLQEGLQEYRGSDSMTKEEIMHTIQESIEHVKLPEPINESHEMREEIVMAVRECLEEFKPAYIPQQQQQQQQADPVSRQVVLDAVREALAGQDLSGPREIEISREDLQEAVVAGLQGTQLANQNNGEAVLQSIHSLVDEMHSEFKSYSSANGRDTEQVLDALRDGLDRLRAEIEGYVDRAQDVTQKDEIVDTMRAELERLRNDVKGYIAEGTQRDHTEEMVAYIKTEFEQLQESMGSQLALPQNNEEILSALHAGFEGMKSQVATRGLDLESDNEISEAMKSEFDHLKDLVTGDTTNNKDEILEKLQDGFDGIHGRLDGQISLATPNDEMLSGIKEEFEHLRQTLGNSLVRSGGADTNDIIQGVRELIDDLRAHQGNELEEFKERLGSTLVPTTANTSNEELLQTIKSGLDDLKSHSKTLGIDEELLEALRGEMEQIRQSNGLTRQHSRADTEEVLESVRLGLDDLRSHLEKKLDNPERHMNVAGDVIEALNDGLKELNADIAKMVDKPVDMTVSYEILDTLKDGLAGLREDIDKLKGHRAESDIEDRELPTGNEVVLAEDPDQIATRDISPDSLRRNDLEKMEVMLSQLHIKVEAMDANIQNPIQTPEPVTTEGSAMKDGLSGIEELLKDLQFAVLQLQDKERAAPSVEGLASKEDTDAIETLLGNMKAKMDEISFPDPATIITRENLDDVELVVRTTAEAIETLSKKIEEEGASKGDVAVVQVIVDDIKNSLEEMKASKPAEEEEEGLEKVTKTDVDGLALLVCDVKAKLDEMKIPDGDELPSKADMEQLTGLIHDFRDSHDKMKDSYESDIAITAKAFDDRKKEAEGLVETMGDVKVLLDDLKEDIRLNLIEGGPIEGLKDSFKSLEDTIGVNFSITADVKELMETVSREFERAHGSIEGLRNDQEEKSASTLEKHDEAKEAIITGLVTKIDERFDTLMAKYDDAQLLADEQAKVMKEKAEEQERVLESTKRMADELKITIDTLGASITGMNDRFEQATQKWANDSATVFGKIDDTMAKLEEHQLDGKTEHSHTRDEIANVERNFNGLHDNITEYHPKFMVTLREIEALVKQHYDHSQKAKEASDEQARCIAEEARSRAEQIQNHFSSLPALLPAPPPAIEFPEKYNDAPVQEKLDKLLGHVEETEKSTSHLERLDEIHKQVMATAAEVTEFVAKQTQLITDGRESKEREAEELGLQVERRLAQKEHLDADIEALKIDKERVMQELRDEKARVMEELKEEKDRTIAEIKEEKDLLLSIVAALQVERENLANQKVRLTGEVSSLHTALEIRREELHFMDVKADALERRILNGIMDHSRALMIAKGGSKAPGKPKKRVSADVSDEASKMMPPPSMAANGLSLALKPRPAIRRNGAQPNPAGRRIHSLSQISGNTPPGVQTFHTTANKMVNTGNLKRSHSVKTNYLRKTSWGGRPNVAETVTELDKENEILGEESETETESRPAQLQIEAARSIASSHYDDDLVSEDGTERRHSISNHSYADSYADGETPGYDGRSSFGGAGSDYTYGSGSSYMTGSDIDRRTSYGSTAARSTLLGGADTIDEDSESDDGSHYESGEDAQTTTILPVETPTEAAAEEDIAKPEEQQECLEIVALREEDLVKPNLRIYAAPSDSGLGTDLATGAEGGMSEADYFRRAAEEESTVG
ncbi:hypothetical protein P154DRAFT_490145 [Amniculicola lignicola CBS 123094]|uniref:Chromosome segregation ATPase family protein n=1 Tax=Amniculicola lignicola CBS 123094 TaxID=1392246 RepID=A0A6A5WKG5_9PLEO|nr:hypothetical protein P154DRAFT_490145 [Amniculicola lignicola CBS 123094]